MGTVTSVPARKLLLSAAVSDGTPVTVPILCPYSLTIFPDSIPFNALRVSTMSRASFTSFA